MKLLFSLSINKAVAAELHYKSIIQYMLHDFIGGIESIQVKEEKQKVAPQKSEEHPSTKTSLFNPLYREKTYEGKHANQNVLLEVNITVKSGYDERTLYQKMRIALMLDPKLTCKKVDYTQKIKPEESPFYGMNL